MIALLEVVGASKAFDGRTLFDGLSFTVEAGTLTALAGEWGTGKTTLLRVIADVERR